MRAEIVGNSNSRKTEIVGKSSLIKVFARSIEYFKVW